MKISQKLYLLVVFGLAVVVFLFPNTASACGGFTSRIGTNVKPDSLRAAIIYDPVRNKGQEQLIVELNYLVNRGSPSEFGWVMPVPTKPTVQAASPNFFYNLEIATRKKPNYLDEVGTFRDGCKSIISRLESVGQVFSAVTKGLGKSDSVTVVSQQQIGQYELSVLAATDQQSLQDWATRNGYATKPLETKAIADYINAKWYFVLAKLKVEPEGDRRSSSYLFDYVLSRQAILLNFASPSIVYPWRLAAYNQLGQVATDRQLPVSLYVFYPEARPEPARENLLTYTYGEKLTETQRGELLAKIPDANMSANFLSYYQSPSIEARLLESADLVLNPSSNSKEINSGKMDFEETLRAIGLSLAYPLIALILNVWPLAILIFVTFWFLRNWFLRNWLLAGAVSSFKFNWSHWSLWLLGLAWLSFFCDVFSCAIPSALVATEFLTLTSFLALWVTFMNKNPHRAKLNQ